jgi:hypothetical protein
MGRVYFRLNQEASDADVVDPQAGMGSRKQSFGHGSFG